MWELDHKEGWVPKDWCFQTVVLGKTLESPLDSKEIKPVHSKWNQSWLFIGRTDAEAEAPILWPPDVNSLLTGRDPDTGKDWGQEEKEGTEDDWIASSNQCCYPRWLDSINSMDISLCKLWETVKHRESWCGAVHGVTKGWKWLSDWTTRV